VKEKKEIKNPTNQKNEKTYIIQLYISKPLLYLKRKFDIRCYMLFTSINGVQQGYWYNDGYVRTASLEYDEKYLENKYIHLTNDAIQQNHEIYGKYESGNKISLEDLHKYIFAQHQQDFLNKIFPKFKKIA
jgi:tubulin---tyrosine ligase